MSENIYKIIEIVGTSANSIEEAINTAISCASETINNLGWFEVMQTRGQIENGKAVQFQVILKVGFTLK